MKILMVSMPSLHFYRWTEQLKDSGHDIYWFNITDSGEYVNRMNWIQQKFGWKLKWNYPGRIFIKSKFPKLYQWIQKFNENKTDKAFEKYLLEVNPDVVQSFVMYMSCAPILEIMNKYHSIPWIYSAWGNDLFFYQNDSKRRNEIISTLPRINFMFADCYRDYLIATKHGFKGTFFGVYPGGGGYHLQDYENYKKKAEDRRIILVKGYENHFGRCNNVLEALLSLADVVKNYEIIVFGANQIVIDFVKKKKLESSLNIKVFGKMNHEEIFKWMGKSKFYIGNNISDGMPNTLLEAIIMECFPIQSNPGGATAEIISNKNGVLIDFPEDVENIKNKLIVALSKLDDELKLALNHNKSIVKNLEFEYVKEQVLNKYKSIFYDKK